MNVKRIFGMAVALMGLLCFAMPAAAQISVYQSLAAFTAATSRQGTDTFDNLPATLSPVSSPASRSTAGNVYTYQATTTGGNLLSVGTAPDRWLSTEAKTQTITLSGWGANVNGVGGNFFDNDESGVFLSGTITVTATDRAGTVTRTIVSATTNSFLGFVSSNGLSSLTVTAVQPQGGTPAVYPTINNLVIAAPEPATWAMLLLGFAIVGWALRRRRARDTGSMLTA